MFRRLVAWRQHQQHVDIHTTHFHERLTHHRGRVKPTFQHRKPDPEASSSVRTTIISPAPSENERAVFVAGTVLTGLAAIYWIASRDYVVITGRQRTMAFSWQFEANLAKKAEARVDNVGRDIALGRRLSPEEDYRAKEVAEIFRRVITVVEQDLPDIGGKFPWKVDTRESTKVNAFCEPGGRMVVFTGIVDFLAKQESDGNINDARTALAAVIAHEIGHGVARHGMEKASWLPFQLPFIFLAEASELLFESFLIIFKLPHSRLLETEADIIGSELMARAGYDPREAPVLFSVLNKKSKLFEWHSTHPVGKTRAEKLQSIMDKELELYHANRNRFPNDGAKPKLGELWKKHQDALDEKKKNIQ